MIIKISFSKWERTLKHDCLSKILYMFLHVCTKLVIVLSICIENEHLWLCFWIGGNASIQFVQFILTNTYKIINSLDFVVSLIRKKSFFTLSYLIYWVNFYLKLSILKFKLKLLYLVSLCINKIKLEKWSWISHTKLRNN